MTAVEVKKPQESIYRYNLNWLLLAENTVNFIKDVTTLCYPQAMSAYSVTVLKENRIYLTQIIKAKSSAMSLGSLHCTEELLPPSVREENGKSLESPILSFHKSRNVRELVAMAISLFSQVIFPPMRIRKYLILLILVDNLSYDKLLLKFDGV